MFRLQNKFQLILALGLVALLAHNAESKQQLDKMARIQVASVQNFPFIIQLRHENGEFLCAGALISPSHVLTAAQCFDDNDYAKTVVVGGASTVEEAGVHRTITKVTKHPAYNSQTKLANAAVLKLSTPMPIESHKIEVVELLDQSIAESTPLALMGWRHIAAFESNPGLLIATRLTVSEQVDCEKEFNATGANNIFCVTGVFDEQFCVGDLGSPAVTFTKKLAGITTAAHNCKEAEHVTSFTNVYGIRSFVDEAMK